MRKLLLVFSIAFTYLFVGCDFNKSTKHKYDTGSDIPTTLIYKFKNKSAEQLSVKAFKLNAENKFEQAIEIYQQAILIEPNNPKLYFDISTTYQNMDKLDEGILMLDKAINLDSLNPKFYNNKGLIYFKRYQESIAIPLFKKAIKLDSTNYITHFNLSIALYTLNNVDEACQEFKLAKQYGLDVRNLKNEPEGEKLKYLCKQHYAPPASVRPAFLLRLLDGQDSIPP